MNSKIKSKSETIEKNKQRIKDSEALIKKLKADNAALEKEVRILQEREILNWFKKSGLSFEEFSEKFIENENDIGNSDGDEPGTDLFANLTDNSDITEANDGDRL